MIQLKRILWSEKQSHIICATPLHHHQWSVSDVEPEAHKHNYFNVEDRDDDWLVWQRQWQLQVLGWVTRTKKEGAEINKNHRASTPNPAPEPVRTVFIFNLKHCAPILIMKWICSDPQVHKTFVLIVSNNANVVQVEIRKKRERDGKK